MISREELLDRAKGVDLLEALSVEIMIDQSNKLWINVDGKCLLRIGQVDNIILESDGTTKEYPNTRRSR